MDSCTPQPTTPTRRGARRLITLAAIVALVLGAVGAFLLAAHDPDDESEAVVVAAATDETSEEGATTSTLDRPPPRASFPDASLEGHPQEEWYTEDPEGQALAEAFRRQRETGWTAVQLTPDLIGWMTLECWQAQRPGSVGEVADGDGEVIGYYIASVGYADLETFESEDFNWRALARENFPREEYPVDVAQQDIDSIENQGGLSEVCRIDS